MTTSLTYTAKHVVWYIKYNVITQSIQHHTTSLTYIVKHVVWYTIQC